MTFLQAGIPGLLACSNCKRKCQRPDRQHEMVELSGTRAYESTVGTVTQQGAQAWLKGDGPLAALLSVLLDILIFLKKIKGQFFIGYSPDV